MSLLGLAGAASAEQIAPEALAALPPAQVVVLGEVHDNGLHHLNQAAALAGLRPAAVVWEMLTQDQAARVPTDATDIAALDSAIGWSDSGWPALELYHPVFLAGQGALHVGAAVPRAEARRVFAEPLAEVFGPEAAAFGLAEALPEAEAAVRGQEMIDSHCGALPETVVPGMIAAQRLRDGALARAALAALAETGGPVAVITGNGHARADWAVPALIARAAPQVSVLSLGQLEAAPEAPPPYDLWLVTQPAERGDPCAAFR